MRRWNDVPVEAAEVAWRGQLVSSDVSEVRMDKPELPAEVAVAADQVLGYLNFSSGAADPRVLAAWNELYAALERNPNAAGAREPTRHAETYLRVRELLAARLAALAGTTPAFAEVTQAEAALQALFDDVLPGYLAFHRDLLFHQSAASLFRPFFVGRVAEAVLQVGPPWEDRERIVRDAVQRLNDFLGYRPVASLETQKTEPYPHEYSRPLPLFIRDAGIETGPRHDVLQLALEILRDTEPDLLHEACLALDQMEELALDVRAYDFDHPVNRRPNYHFGLWDPARIDAQGMYTRFVVQQVTFDALLQRVLEPENMSAEEALYEGAAVLAGTILMASGISGYGPETFDSSVSLTTLLPRIAAYRDEFYERLIAKTQGEHGRRLKKEAKLLRQPFAGARQHLNAALARRRAMQLEHVTLAKIVARIGFSDAARRQASVVPTASARIMCQIDCLLVEAFQQMERGDLADSVAAGPKIRELLDRGIQCGAIIDPWNILGFDANFSLFPSLENSIRDHRADELVALAAQIVGMYARTWREAAARDDSALAAKIRGEFRSFAEWWRQFAAHEVSGVEALNVDEAFQAAEHVAEALNLWHRGGARAGDVAFWRRYGEMFNSPEACALVVDAVLERGDHVAAMALLIHWLSQSEEIGLEESSASFSRLVERWMQQLLAKAQEDPDGAADRWQLVCKLFDFIEANAGEYWRIPNFYLGDSLEAIEGEADDDRELALPEDPDEDIFDAAYEDVVYRDTTDDGVEGPIYEPTQGDEELEAEVRRVGERLDFHGMLARLWSMSVGAALDLRRENRSASAPRHQEATVEPLQVIAQWRSHASASLAALLELLADIDALELPDPTGDQESLLEYDRQRLMQDSLLERTLTAIIDHGEALMLLEAAEAAFAEEATRAGLERPTTPTADFTFPDMLSHLNALQDVLAACLLDDAEGVRKGLYRFLEDLSEHPLLYVPLSEGGDPHEIAAARLSQRAVRLLLTWLPRLGLLSETCDVVEAARRIEKQRTVGPAAVTEFDALFEVGFRALVECLVASARGWESRGEDVESDLVACVDLLTNVLSRCWQAHSRTLRLSVLETVAHRRDWNRLVEFISHYGSDLFTQKFMNPGNLRAIIHQGVEEWFDRVREAASDDELPRLVRDLDRGVPTHLAARQLELVLKAIVENYTEYRDYNSTTTQSDRGELLYTLLDFIRLRVRYDRVAWDLKPMVLAHEILVRAGRHEAAAYWRQSIEARTAEEADRLTTRLQRLKRQHAMRMPTVADRIAERFVHPLTIDRLRALVGPAIEEAFQGGPHPAFDALLEEAEQLLQTPSGVGLDVPAWLLALDEEIDQYSENRQEAADQARVERMIPTKPLSIEQIQEQLDNYRTRVR